MSRIIDCKRYSTAKRLYRVTAYVLKFLSLLKKKTQSHELTPQDLTEAERLWITDCQATLVSDHNFPAWKAQFNPFKVEDKLWRCGGRLQNAELPFSTKHLILLSKEYHLTSLIVMSAHQRVQHNGVKETLTEVRSRYWIIGGRNLVKLIIHKCVICRRFDGKPFQHRHFQLSELVKHPHSRTWQSTSQVLYTFRTKECQLVERYGSVSLLVV